jgi:glycosyltransferase involved in cell wall biosynthesis
MLLLDLTHTSHTRARTGIQRVCRSLHAALERTSGQSAPITHDPFWQSWRPLETWEHANLAHTSAAPRRGAQWPWPKRLRGRAAWLLGSRAPALPPATGLVVPEIFSPVTAGALPELFAAIRGPRVALFHDAIALKFPELTPAKTVARFPAYLRELRMFDGIAAVSEDSRQSLLDFWTWCELTDLPPVTTIPLGLHVAPTPSSETAAPQAPASAATPVILSVGSLEGRKNHVALLDACEGLWSRGLRFELQLIGLAHPQTGRDALAKVQSLQAAGRPLRYDGPVDEAALERAYARCAFTVYPSLMEGFGLPVLESLAHRKPCICSARGALGESARGGGCLALDDVSAPELAKAIGHLLTEPAARAELTASAASRRFKTWGDYAGELTAWMQTLRRRAD